jgi:hypothetical protein
MGYPPEIMPYLQRFLPPEEWARCMDMMGLHNAVRHPVQPLSPGDFGLPVPAGPQPGNGPQEAPGLGGLSPGEKEVLRGMLDVLKQGRTAMASGAVDGVMAQRLTAAHAYVSGFLEAKGMGELGAFLRAMPPPMAMGDVTES